MAKRILRVNAEGELIDSINPSIHFDISGGRGGITRKQVKEKAVNLANTWTGDLGTNQDYVEGNIYLQGNKRRQRLFDRTFNKQYGKNVMVAASPLETNQKKAGINSNKGLLSKNEQLVSQIINLYQNGKTIKQIARTIK